MTHFRIIIALSNKPKPNLGNLHCILNTKHIALPQPLLLPLLPKPTQSQAHAIFWSEQSAYNCAPLVYNCKKKEDSIYTKGFLSATPIKKIWGVKN